ncbi:MAG TPA: hypothetical protein VM223_09610, partial [Planctomycetota bacterium]|nr:hypothetical protein [Planctomycetota bacterium]
MNEKQLQKSLQNGWNTWDVRSVTTHVLLPDRVAVRFALMDAANRTYMADFGWAEVDRFGPHAPDGSYTCIDLKHGEHRLRIETAADGRKFVAVATRLSRDPFHLQVEASLLWGSEGTITAGGRVIDVAPRGGAAHRVTASAKHDPPPSDPSMGPHLAFPLTGPVAICC